MARAPQTISESAPDEARSARDGDIHSGLPLLTLR